MNIKRNIITAIFAGLFISGSFSVAAQDRAASKGQKTIGVNYSISSNQDFSGFQFDLVYDPASHEVADLSNCLSGLPESHKGEFSICNHVAEKSLIRFVVLDLGRNRALDLAGPIGRVEFRTVGANKRLESSLARGSAPHIENAMLADLEGMELKSNSKGNLVKISVD